MDSTMANSLVNKIMHLIDEREDLAFIFFI